MPMPSGTSNVAESSTDRNSRSRRASITIAGVRLPTTAGREPESRRCRSTRSTSVRTASDMSTTSTGHPSTRARAVALAACGGSTLPLGVLRCLPGSLEAVLLAFLLSRVAGEQPCRLECGAQLGVGSNERSGDPVTHRARLPGDAAAADLDRHLETAGGLGEPERLGDHRLQVTAAEVLAGW